MQTKPLTSKEYFRALKVIHFALVAGVAFFALITLFMLQVGKIDMGQQGLTEIFIFIVPLFAAGGIVSSQVLFKIKLKGLRKMTDLPEKLTEYRSVLVIRYALLEGASFFTIVIYMLTGDLLFLGMAGLLILVFLFIRPTVEKAGNDLELDRKEKQLLADPNAVVGEVNVENNL